MALRTPVYLTKFTRDIKKVQRRGYDMELLKVAIHLLLEGSLLPVKYKDHALTGEWRGYRDLHIEPDWVLIYKIDGDACIFARTGTHSDLF